MAETIEHERGWLPAEWVDEAVPTLMATHDHFIERQGDAWLLRLPKGDLDRDNEFYCTPIEPGQVVAFNCNEHYGEFELTVGKDGQFRTDRTYPDRANCFAIDWECMADTLAGLVKGDGWQDPVEPGVHALSIYYWSEDIPFRFDLNASGDGRFVLVAGAN
jgi:hypothetical protein